MVVNASEIDATVFVWLLIVVPVLGGVVGIAAWSLARHRQWSHPVLAGLATGVSAVLAGWVGIAIFDAING